MRVVIPVGLLIYLAIVYLRIFDDDDIMLSKRLKKIDKKETNNHTYLS